MSAGRALRLGLMGAVRAPALVGWLWLVNALLALGPALAMADELARAIGPSLAHEGMRDGFDMGFFAAWQHDATGLARSFDPTHHRGGAWLANLDAVWDGSLFSQQAPLLALGLLHGLLWLLLLGGVLDALANPRRPVRLRRVLTRGTTTFGPFVRVGAVFALAYAGVLAWLAFAQRAIDAYAESATTERSVLVLQALAIAGSVLLLTVVNMMSDYAKIALALGRRRGALAAALYGATFVGRHPLRCGGVYYGLLGLGCAGLAAYVLLLAPGTGHGSWGGIALAMAAGQLALAGKLVLRLAFQGAQLELMRSSPELR